MIFPLQRASPKFSVNGYFWNNCPISFFHRFLHFFLALHIFRLFWLKNDIYFNKNEIIVTSLT